MRGLAVAQHGALALRRAGTAVPVPRRLSVRALQVAVAIAVVPAATSAMYLALTSGHVERPVATGLYRSYLAAAPMLIGLYWWRRRGMSRFGPVLICFGLSAWAVSWQSSDWPLAFDLGVLAEGPAVVLTIYLFLAFPSGRLENRVDRLQIGAWSVAAFGFFVPWALWSPVIAGGEAMSGCVPACPANVLQIGSAPRLVEFLGRWETYLMLTLGVVAFVVFLQRLRTASRPRRRALLAVATTSLLFLPAFFVFHFSRLILELDPATLEMLSWAVVGTRILLPLGFLYALLQADLFAGVARGRLLDELGTHPSPGQWRDAVARALHDPQLRLAYWDPSSGTYREPSGEQLVAPAGDRAWIEVDRDGRPVAAMVIDGALAEDPELVQAATSATILAVENGTLEGALRDSQSRILAAGDTARRRIERDLHDGAQQRLVALRIHLALASERMEGAEQRSMVEDLGIEVEAALDELRDVARGVYPEVLRQGGTAAALRSVSRHAAILIDIDDGWTYRYGEELEKAVYFCCLEALQNAAKHAGTGAVASVRLTEVAGRVRFTVEDDGVGFDPRTVERGAGLENVADRVSAAGGTLRVDAARGRGTRVSGDLPATPPPPPYGARRRG